MTKMRYFILTGNQVSIASTGAFPEVYQYVEHFKMIAATFPTLFEMSDFLYKKNRDLTFLTFTEVQSKEELNRFFEPEMS